MKMGNNKYYTQKVLSIENYQLLLEEGKPVIRKLICDNPEAIPRLEKTFTDYIDNKVKHNNWEDTIKHVPVEDFEIVLKLIKQAKELGYYGGNQ